MNTLQTRKTLAIIGAGPKGLAVAVKAKVLQEFGFDVDHVILIEKNQIAANWCGEYGYTNGDMKLGTSPEKDVVFPVETDVDDDILNSRIKERLLHFSWTSFLVHSNRYSDWVDRGRPAPSHKLWASYLQWVAKQLTNIIYAEVIKIDLTQDGNRWELILNNSAHKRIEADRLMLTGPGKTRMDFADHTKSVYPLTYDLETFWHALKKNSFSKSGKIAVVGSGEHAASVLLAMTKYSSQLSVDVISPKGFISSRAESYYENRMYSEPEIAGWKTLTISDRLNFINRTDLGVFSVHAMQILSDEMRHDIIPGRVVGVKQELNGICLKLVYADQAFFRTYDQVIFATGFDQIAMLKTLFSTRAQIALTKTLASAITQQSLAAQIDTDLSVRGMRPYLHLPMLANLMQGPGFTNLSCLGRLSDRVMTNFKYQINQPANEKIIPFLQEAIP